VNLAYGQLIIQAEDFYQNGIPTMEENDSVGAFLEREYEDTLERYTNGDRHIRELYILHDLHRIFHHFHTQHNIHIGLFQDLGIVYSIVYT
jgi:hypothetical protein